MSVVTLGELRRGITLLPNSARRNGLEGWFSRDLVPRFFDRILPVTHAIGERWGVLSAHRQLSGIPLGVADGLIAATALEHDLTLVTRNTKDFADLDVIVINPWGESIA